MPLGIQETYYRKLLGNDVFVVSESVTLLDGETYNINIRNPADSDRTMIFTEMLSNGDGSHISRMHDEFSSAPSGGSDIEIQAGLLDSDGANDDGSAEVAENVSFTDGAATFATVGGARGANSIGGEGSLPSLAMEPGREIVVELENTSGAEQAYSLTLIYFEKDGIETE